MCRNCFHVGEHVLIELLQANGSAPTVLASYETSAKDFLYPYSWDRIQYTGLRRYVLLSRTVDFPGVSPSFEFTVSPSIQEGGSVRKSTKTYKLPAPINSGSKSVGFSFSIFSTMTRNMFDCLSRNGQSHLYGGHHLPIQIGN